MKNPLYKITFVYAIVAVLMGASAYALYLFYPVSYAQLICEDYWGEYVTFSSFGLAGLSFLFLSIRRGSVLRRIAWGLIGIIALFIAAEEISWGQRVLHFSTPESILGGANVQGEYNFHNLYAVQTTLKNFSLHRTLGILIIGWSLLSVIFSSKEWALKKTNFFTQLPFIQPPLIPLFLLPAFFFMVYPTIKSDELGELFLGTAILMWAADLIYLNLNWQTNNVRARSLWVIGFLLFVFIVSLFLSNRHDNYPAMSWRLERMSARDYPNREMYDQSEKIYQYLYANPKLMTQNSRFDHGAILVKSGQKDKAALVLAKFVEDMHVKRSEGALQVKGLRRLCVAYKLMGDVASSGRIFNEAVQRGESVLTEGGTPTEIALANWSLAKVQVAGGNSGGGLERALGSRAGLLGSRQGFLLGKWIDAITKLNERNAQYVDYIEWVK